MDKIEKTVVIQPPAYGQQEQTQPGWKQSGNVRLLIIAVSVVLVVGVVTTAFTLTFKHHTEATEKALASNTKRIVDDEGEETIESDDEALTKLYTVTTEEGIYKVLYDYNKNIRLVRRNEDCIVTPMNSSEADPQTALEKGLQAEEGHAALYERDNVPIRDHSFLGDKGQEMCDGKLVYWGLPNCDGDEDLTVSPANSTDVGSRDKRATTYRYGPCRNCCITSCGYRVCYRYCLMLVRTRYTSGYTRCRWYYWRC